MNAHATNGALPPLLVAALVLAAGCGRQSVPTAAEGRTLYAQNGCASCHGQDGRGDGPVAPTLTPRPTDFHDAAAFKPVDAAAIAATIASGVAAPETPAPDAPAVTAHHRQAMPAFGHLSEVERQSLALYILSLRNESR